jgi:hypothetical protein
MKRKVMARRLEVGICGALRRGWEYGMWGVDVSGVWGRRERQSLSFALLCLGVQRAEVGWMAD